MPFTTVGAEDRSTPHSAFGDDRQDVSRQGLAVLGLSDWLRMWATLPARQLPPRIAHEVRLSTLEFSTLTYSGLAVLAFPCAVAVTVGLVPLDETRGRWWAAVHLMVYLHIAILSVVFARYRRRGDLSAGKINPLLVPSVAISGLLWGVLPGVVGHQSNSLFFLTATVSTVTGFVGFFWNSGNWPMAILWAAICLSSTTFWVIYYDMPNQALVVSLMCFLFLMLVVLSFLSTVALVSARYETVMARERKQMVQLLLQDYERGGHDWVWATDDQLCFSHVPPRMVHATNGDDRFRAGRSLMALLEHDPQAQAAVKAELPFQTFVRDGGGSAPIAIRLWGRPNVVGKRCLGYLGVGSDEGAALVAAQAELTRERLDAMVTLTSGLAHDFNNSLATILSSIELVGLGIDRGVDIHAHLRQATEACLRTRRVTADLVAAAGQDHTSRPTSFELVELAHDVVDEVRPLFPEIEFSVSDSGESVCALADRNHCMRTLRNLVDNACHAIADTPCGRGRVEVSVGTVTDDDGLTVCSLVVRDDGPGVPLDLRTHIFEPFFSTRKGDGGTGLGLAVASGFARQSGGSLTLEASDTGATFALTLPTSSSVDTVNRGVIARPLAPERSLLDGGRVLVVEDDRHLADTLGQWFSGFGAITDVVNSLEEATVYLERNHHDLACVISDLVLPDGEGYDVVAAWRRWRPGAPAVYMSGFTRTLPGHVQPDLQCPFVAKPFSSSEMLRAIARSGIALDPYATGVPQSSVAVDFGT